MIITDADPDETAAIAAIRHNDDCTDQTRYRTRERGAIILVTCCACGRSRPLLAQDDQPELVQVIEPTPKLRARWRCSAHPDQRVSWHGRDCPECIADRASYRERRQERRAARRRQ